MEELTEYLANASRKRIGITIESKESEFKRVAVKYNVCYIVAAVIIRDSSVLMMRESKRSAYGQWYLPAGQMERDETIEEAVKREVKEETLADVDVLSLLSIESNGPFWFRFTFACKCTSDTLKTPEQEDEHSIEARWIQICDVLAGDQIDLRCKDIIPLIRNGDSWYKAKLPVQEAYLLPTLKSHATCIVRVYLISTGKDGFYMFLGKQGHFTEKIIQSVDGALKNVIFAILQNSGFVGSFTSHGVISLEHTGKEFSKTDGFMLHVLAQANEEVQQQELHEYWEPLQDSKVCSSLRNVVEKCLCPPIL